MIDMQKQLRKTGAMTVVSLSLTTVLVAGDFRVPPEAPVSAASSHERGTELSAYVGDVLASVKVTRFPWVLVGGQSTGDCRILWKEAPKKKKPKVVVVANDVTLSLNPFWEVASEEFELSLTDEKQRSFEITPEGDFTGNYVAAWGRFRVDAWIEPDNCKFEPVFQSDEETVSVLNAELIYNGRSATALRFLYQEYTAHDLLHAPSRRELEYPTASETVRASRFRLEILEATSELIRYKILEDGTEDL